MFGLFLGLFLLLFTSPCQAQISGITVTASNQSDSNSSPRNILDHNPSTIWNSGASAPQWILLDLGKPYNLNHLRLKSAQFPSGQSINTLYFGSTLESLSPMFTINQIFTPGEWIDIPFPSPVDNIRYFKIVTNSSPSWVAWHDIEVYDTSMPSPIPVHLKYFGYYGLVGGLYPNYAYYFEEIGVLKNSNVGIVPYNGNDLTKLRQILDLARRQNLQVFIAPRWSLYSGSSLAPNYLTSIHSLVPIITEYSNTVLGFYFDEMHDSSSDISNFITVTQALHNSFPTKKILAVEADSSLDTLTASYFTFVTDIGFDYYFTSKSPDNEAGWSHFLSSYSKLKNIAPFQPIWIITDGIATTVEESAKWPDAFEKYYSLALTDNRVVGLLNFIWYTLEPDEPYGITFQSVFNPASTIYNANFKARHIAVGQSIISKNIIPTPTVIPTSTIIPIPEVKPGDANSDTKIDLLDFNIWKNEYLGILPAKTADFNRDNVVDLLDFVTWKQNI